jgi:tetratricopeptide (TPR) repeat protein
MKHIIKSLGLPVSPAILKEANKMPRFAELVTEKEKIDPKNSDLRNILEAGITLLSIGNGLLDFHCASGGNFMIAFPALNHAYDLLPDGSDPSYRLLIQSAIGLETVGERAQALERLDTVLKFYLSDPRQIKDLAFRDSPLAYALKAFWPGESGGPYKISGIALFDAYADLVQRRSGLEAKEHLWASLVKHLQIGTLFSPLQAHCRLMYAEMLLAKKEFRKAVSIMNEAMYCYEKARLENYPAMVHICRSILGDIQVNGRRLVDDLLVLNYIQPATPDEGAELMASLQSGKDSYETRVNIALKLLHSAQLISERTTVTSEISRAVQYLNAAQRPLLEWDLGQAITCAYMLTLNNLHLGNEAEAIVSLKRGVELHKKLPIRGYENMMQCERNVLSFHLFSRPLSAAQDKYRKWREQVILSVKKSGDISDNLFSEAERYLG